MKIGVLSDTHNHSGHLERALTLCRQAGVSQIFHCGDLTDARLVSHFKGFKVNYVTGNVDRNPTAITRALRQLDRDNTCGSQFSGVYAGLKIAATHGHLVGDLDELTGNGRHAFVFHGHTHRRRDERQGNTRIINPGALGGTRYESRSFCLLDLATGEASFVEISDW